MNEKVFIDQYQKNFGDEEKIITFLQEREENSAWQREKSGEIRFSAAVRRYMLFSVWSLLWHYRGRTYPHAWVTVPKINENDLPPEYNEPLPQEPVPQQKKVTSDVGSKKSSPKGVKKEELSEHMSVEEPTKKITLDDAWELVVKCKCFLMKTMGYLINLIFFARKF